MAIHHPLSPNGATHALLDANVLLPPRLSDVMFDLCLEGLYSARWSEQIEEEFLRNWPRVVAKVQGALTARELKKERAKAQRRLECYQGAVREYEIFGHDKDAILNRVPGSVHSGDKHVAAASLVLLDYAEAPNDKVFLVSSNLSHLAVAQMSALGVEVVSPGRFIDLLAQGDPLRVEAALNRSVTDLTEPPYTRRQLLESLRLHRALATVEHFEKAWMSGLD